MGIIGIGDNPEFPSSIYLRFEYLDECPEFFYTVVSFSEILYVCFGEIGDDYESFGGFYVGENTLSDCDPKDLRIVRVSHIVVPKNTMKIVKNDGM